MKTEKIKTVLVGIATKLQWNLDMMKGQETGKICSLQRGFEVLFHIFYYYYYWSKENTEDVVILL